MATAVRSRPALLSTPGLRDGQQALLLLQEKWAMFIVDTLGEGSMGFNELSRVAASINPATLSQRLASLEQAGVVAKEIHSTMPPRTSYALTPAGLALLPAIDALKRWGSAHLPRPDLDCG